MKTVRMVRPSELRKIMQEREIEERKRKEEAEDALAADLKKAPAKGGAKPPAKKDDTPPEKLIKIYESEEATAELIDTIQEPEHEKVEGSDRA